MKKFLTMLVLCGLFGSIAACGGAKPKQPPDLSGYEKNRQAYLTIPAPSLANNTLNEPLEQGIGIYLPPSYHHSDQAYPVVYFLPGYGDGHLMFMNNLTRYLNTLYDEQKSHEMILVTVNGMNQLQGGFYTNSPVTGNWADFIAQDVVGYIDANYRTVQSAEGRGIAGHSMGGFGAINIALHNKDLFGSVYSMSPGLFAEDGFTQSPFHFDEVETVMAHYAGMSDTEAREEFLTFRFNFGNLYQPSTLFSMAYGVAFAGDPSLKAPYIQMPEKDASGAYIQDDAWKRLEGGYGNWPEKLDTYGENLAALKGFVIDYGLQDEYTWIPQGCEYFSQQLAQRNIVHTLNPYEGTHSSKANDRLKNNMLPFFSEMFSTIN